MQAQGRNFDIIVFPEGTFNYYGLTNNRNDLIENAVTIPNPNENITPKDDPTYEGAIRLISEKAAENEMYILINVIEKSECDGQVPTFVVDQTTLNQHSSREIDANVSDCQRNGTKLYNTNVVFDRNGTVVSKYRKHNVFNETQITRDPNFEEADLATFTTDFGIQFGHFIGFDILFKKPSIK